jgi:tetratricopeptide (TPR) repeat protein
VPLTACFKSCATARMGPRQLPLGSIYVFRLETGTRMARGRRLCDRRWLPAILLLRPSGVLNPMISAVVLSRMLLLYSLASGLGVCLLGARQSGEANVQNLIHQGQSALHAGDFTAAVADFEKAHELAPEDIEVARGLMLGYLQSERLEDATKFGEQAVARWPDDPPLRHWLGLAYFKRSETASALDMLQRAEKLDPSTFDIHFDVALVLLAQANYPGAADELEQAVRLNSTDALSRVLLGRAYQNSNRTLPAIEQFKAALRIDPTLPLAHYHLGFAYASLGQNQQAIAEYEKEITLTPQDPQVRYALGHALLESGDWMAAITALKKAVELDPQNADANYDLGKALLLRGDPESALAALGRASQLKPTDPSPHYQLARALEKLGRKDEAQQEWKLFAELKSAQPQKGGMASGRTQ